MKYWLAFVLLVFWCSSFIAQNANQGENWQNQKNFYPLKFIGTNTNKLYLAYGASEKAITHIQHLAIEVIDTLSLKHITTKNFQNVFTDKFDFYPEDVQLKNGKINFFGSSYDKKTKTNQLFIKEEVDSGVLSTKKLLWEYPASYFEASSRKFKFCTNKKQDLLLSLGVQTSNSSRSEVHFAVLDKKYQLVKQVHAPIELKGKNIQITQYSLDDPGNVQILFQYQRSNDSLDIGFSLFAFPIFTEDIIEYQLDLPDKQITSINYDLSENDHLKICGLYQTDFNKTDISAGTFYMDIDRETGEVIQKSILPFNASFLGNYAGEAVKVNKDDFRFLKMVATSCSKDGSLLLFAEQKRDAKLCETDYRSGLTVCKDEFKADKILIINFNSSANVDWFQWINKSQQSIDDDGMFLSFNQIFRENASVFLYNELKDKKKQDEKISAQTTTQIKAMLLNSYGQLEENTLNLSSKLPMVRNCFLKNGVNTYYYLRSDLNNNSVFKIQY
jgi:hypothetical protein